MRYHHFSAGAAHGANGYHANARKVAATEDNRRRARGTHSARFTLYDLERLRAPRAV